MAFIRYAKAAEDDAVVRGPECFYSRWRSPVANRIHQDITTVTRGRDTAVLPRTTDQDTTAVLHHTIQNPTAIQVQEDTTTLPHPRTTPNLMVIRGQVGNIDGRSNSI